MHFNSEAFVTVVAMMPLALASSCVPPPNSPVPERYADTVIPAWDNSMARFQREMPAFSPATYMNTALDQIMDGNGTINVCVRWGSNKTVTDTIRQQVATQYTKHYNYWLRWLIGHDNFPFEEVKINYNGWAVRDRAQLQGSPDGVDIYTEYKDQDGYPDCDPACATQSNLDGDFSDCSGGRDHRYHQYLFLNPGWGEYNMGAAIGYGVDLSFYGWETVGSQMEDWPLLLHELGHTLGFLDYIDLEGQPPPDGSDPEDVCDVFFLPPNHPQKFVMKPGNGGSLIAPKLTQMEGWMMRHWWSRVSRLRGWQTDDTAYPDPPDCSSYDDLERRSSDSMCRL